MGKKTTLILILMLVNLVFGGTELNGPVSIDNVPAYGSTATKYLIIDGSDSIVKSRTNTQVLSDIGGASIAALNLKLNISDTSVFARDVDLQNYQQAISGTANRVLKIQSDGTGITESIISDNGTTATINGAMSVSGNINVGGLTASRIVETDATKTLVSVAKNTAYNKNFGTTSGTVCQGNDSRLSDARTPTAHANTHLKGGSDAIVGEEDYGIYKITSTDAWYTGINYGGLGIGSNAGVNRQMMTFTDAANDTQAVFSVITSTDTGVNWSNKFKVTRSGRIKSSDIPALGSTATNYLTSNSGVISSRTIAQVLSDIGAQTAITGTANRVLKIQSDGTGVIESSITDDGTNVNFTNTGYTRFNQPLYISGLSSKTSFYTDNSYPYIYSTATESGSYPFNLFGHLIIQARSTASRNILFVAGKNPAVKMMITPDSVVVNKPLSVNGNVALNASTSGAVSSPVKLSIGVNQWSNGYTRDKLKLELAEGWGFTTGPNLDLQYHATNWHDFYNENSKIFRIGKDSVVVNGNLSLSGDIHNTILGGLSIWANGSEVLRIRDHKLGVNNTNPDSTLTVTGGANITGGLKVGSVFRSFSDSVQINKPLQVHDTLNIYDHAYGDKMSMWYSNRSEAGIINTPQYHGLEFRSNNVKYFSSDPGQTDINSDRTNVKANGDVKISSSSCGVNVSSKLDQTYTVDGSQSMKVGYKKVTVAGLNIGDEYVVTNTTGKATTIYANLSGANVRYNNYSDYPTNLYIAGGTVGDVIFLTFDGDNETYFNYKYTASSPTGPYWSRISSYTVPSMIIKCVADSVGDSTLIASEWRIMYR